MTTKQLTNSSLPPGAVKEDHSTEEDGSTPGPKARENPFNKSAQEEDLLPEDLPILEEDGFLNVNPRTSLHLLWTKSK